MLSSNAGGDATTWAANDASGEGGGGRDDVRETGIGRERDGQKNAVWMPMPEAEREEEERDREASLTALFLSQFGGENKQS